MQIASRRVVRGIVALAAAVLASSLTANSTTLVPADVRGIFNKPLYKNAIWGLRVLDGSKVLVDYNSDRHFFIGSVRKVFSVGQLINTVGPDHRYDTPVYHTGTIVRGVLHGNLILVASGDLTMGGRTNPDGTIAVSDWDHNEADSLGNAVLTKPDPLAGYRTLARAVKTAGIARITGNVIVDDRLFQPFAFRGQFNVRPIFVNDDVVDVSIVPGGKPGALANVSSRPLSAALTVVNRLHVGPPKSKDTLAIDPTLPACIGKPGCTSAITGSLAADYTPPLTGTPDLVQTVRIVQPSNYARTVFVGLLEHAGVAVDAPTVMENPVGLLPRKDAYRASDKVAQLTGLPYAQDAKLILKISYNIGADTSLVLLGVAHHVHSMSAALAFERQDLRAHYGIPTSDYHFIDGSGGGDTTATSRAVTQMLQELAKSPASSAFIAALPILGVDGSLGFVKDFKSDPTLAGAAGNVRAKTGTYVGNSAAGTMELKGQALGGYVTTKSGRHLTFQLVVNNVPIENVPDIIKVFEDQGAIAAMLWRDY
jgi:D-alanyl-D-alanine carboxypeptidase